MNPIKKYLLKRWLDDIHTINEYNYKGTMVVEILGDDFKYYLRCPKVNRICKYASEIPQYIAKIMEEMMVGD